MSTSFPSLPSCLLLSGTLLAGTVTAAAPDSGAVSLPRVEVTAGRAHSHTVPLLPEARAELVLTPGGTETVDPERYLRGRASTLADTFALSAGIVAQARFGADEARLSIRGSGLQRTFHGRGLRLLQDGVPLNLADGGFDMQAIEPLAAAYINVWRGGNALAHGSSTLGGAIDYVSRTGREHARGFARVEAGAHGYRRAALATGGHRGPVDAFASLSHHEQEGFRAHARQSSQRAFANLGLRFGRHGPETRLYLTGVRTASELPGNLTRAQAANAPRTAAPANVALDQRRDFVLVRIAQLTSVRTGPTSWDLSAAWSHKDLDHPIFQVIDQRSRDFLLGVSLTHAGHLGERRQRLRSGAHVTRGSVDAANFVNDAGRRGARVSAARQTAANVEAFVEHELQVTRHLALVTGAAAAANRRSSRRIHGPATDYDRTYRRLLPKLGARFDHAGGQVYANVSASYEPPSFSEALTLNQARRAQRATTVEAGARGTHAFARYDVSLYHAALRDELLALDHDNDPATPAATLNADRTMHQGVELSVELDLLGGDWLAPTAPANRFVLRTAWTWGDFRFDDDPRYGRNRLAGLPPHLVRGELSWEHRSGWYAGPTFEWVPEKTWIDHRNSFAARPHALAGLRLGRRTSHGLSWFAEVRNLADRAYTATTGVIEDARGVDQAQFLPGDGRGFYAGGDYRW